MMKKKKKGWYSRERVDPAKSETIESVGSIIIDFLPERMHFFFCPPRYRIIWVFISTIQTHFTPARPLEIAQQMLGKGSGRIPFRPKPYYARIGRK